VLLAGCRVFTDDSGSASSVSLTPNEKPTATITLQSVSAAFIGSGQGGEGTLYYGGKAYPSYVGGLGIGGIGASTINASGEVYQLNNLSDFPGAYRQVRYGAVAGTVQRDMAEQPRRGHHPSRCQAWGADAEPGVMPW
jgi:hypothetical protein